GHQSLTSIPTDKFQGPNFFFANREFFYEISAHFISTTRRIGHEDLTLRAYCDLGLNDVFCPVASGGGDVSGKTEVLQGRKRHVVGAPDTGFEHASAPDGNSLLLSCIVDRDGFRESADATELDVDDLAGLH